MELKKLMKVLVMGGAMLTSGGCASSNSTPTAKAAPVPAPAVVEDCNEVCEGPRGRERVCPDPNDHAGTGESIKNCCWLMGPKIHQCCE